MGLHRCKVTECAQSAAASPKFAVRTVTTNPITAFLAYPPTLRPKRPRLTRLCPMGHYRCRVSVCRLRKTQNADERGGMSPPNAQRRVARTTASLSLIVLAIAPSISTARDAVYRVPRLSDGRPDLQARWDHIDAAPLERLPGFDSLVITQTQATKIEASLDAMSEDRSTPTEPTEYFNARKILPIRGDLRSSVIVDPESGRLPWKTEFAEWGKKTRRAVVGAFDGPATASSLQPRD